MARIAKHLLLLLLFVSASIAQQPQLKDAEFMSHSLGHTMHYRILLPVSYEKGTQKYPVLYLLHGLYGNYKNWADKTSIAKYLAGADLIIVMPDANDSWYTNWATDPQQKYEDYIIKDLLAEIEVHYRTINARDSRWIAGLSMGGYGALKFGLKYPQLFSVSASFSGALDAPTQLRTEFPAFCQAVGSRVRRCHGATRSDNDIYQLVTSADAAALPYFYLTCGTADHLLAVDREFVAGLPQRKIRYEYHEFPGAHDWVFWDWSIAQFLRRMETFRDLPIFK